MELLSFIEIGDTLMRPTAMFSVIKIFILLKKSITAFNVIL